MYPANVFPHRSSARLMQQPIVRTESSGKGCGAVGTDWGEADGLGIMLTGV